VAYKFIHEWSSQEEVLRAFGSKEEIERVFGERAKKLKECIRNQLSIGLSVRA
jgi:hypothetical protein